MIGAKGFVGRGVMRLLEEDNIQCIGLDEGDDLLRTHEADIVVSATGVKELLDERHLLPKHQLVVDAGFVPTEQGMLGDVKRSAYDIPKNLTPVPGGVGPLQMATLLERLISVTTGRDIEKWTYRGVGYDVQQTSSKLRQSAEQSDIRDSLTTPQDPIQQTQKSIAQTDPLYYQLTFHGMWKKKSSSRTLYANYCSLGFKKRFSVKSVIVPSCLSRMSILACNPYNLCEFGDKRLTRRAVSIAENLSVKYGQLLSTIFKSASDLKRAYEFLSNPKTTFEKLTEPYFKQTVQEIYGLPIVLAVGDTSYLDYRNIVVKREEYGPTGNGGNGLILHTTLAVDPDLGQPLGLLWEKLWHREKKTKPPEGETSTKKKKRLAESRKVSRKRAFEEKESYRWVEAFSKVDKHWKNFPTIDVQKARVVHIFDREGDIAEVFEKAVAMENTGVVVRAAHNRSLEDESLHLWQYVISQPVQFLQEIELPETKKRSARIATLEVRFCPVKLGTPSRLKNSDGFEIFAVYAREINAPEGCEAVEWMLLTTELLKTLQKATQILRWYTYRWRVEEYHKILKSGCKAESYRLAGSSMSTMLGFLTVIASQLLRITYLHRNSPDSPAALVLNPVQMEVLLALNPAKLKNPANLTINWAIRAIARMARLLRTQEKNSYWYSSFMERMVATSVFMPGVAVTLL